MQLWDEQRGRLERVVVSGYALKAVFFVEQWDSRSVAERLDRLPAAVAEGTLTR